jgi:heme/copper-type cytochrome/quinol oxidase subunit 2
VKRGIGILILTATVLAAAMAWPVLQSVVTRAQDETTETVDMTAKKYEFDPSVVHVKAGTKLVLKITSTDRAHGFGISTVAEGQPKGAEPGLTLASPPSKDCYRLDKGQQVTVEIDAKVPGTYPFKCCVRCGMGHGRMKGELIVDPS